MNLLLDTNVLYFLAGVEHSTHDRAKVLAALAGFDALFISELTVLEMLVKYTSRRDKLIAVMNYIAEHHIKVHQILSDEDTIALKANDPRIVTADYFKSITSRALELKIQIESEFATFWFGSISGLLLMILFRLNPDLNDSAKQIILGQYQAVVGTLNSKSGPFYGQVKSALETFYHHDRQKLNDQLNSLLLDIVEVFNAAFEAAKKGVPLPQLGDDSRAYIDFLDDIVLNSSIAKNIRTKKRGRKASILKKSQTGILLAVFASFEANSTGQIDPYLLSYSGDVFKKYLTAEDYRIKKNDIFDSIIAKYCRDYAVMTFDKRFYSVIRKLDPAHRDEYDRLGACV
jgi:predicted nucleic acid-binding protein